MAISNDRTTSWVFAFFKALKRYSRYVITLVALHVKYAVLIILYLYIKCLRFVAGLQKDAPEDEFFDDEEQYDDCVMCDTCQK